MEDGHLRLGLFFNIYVNGLRETTEHFSEDRNSSP